MALKFLLGFAFLRGLWGAYMRRTPIYVNRCLSALAYGDGINDDSRHLQRALDDASRGGGTVQMGRGILALRKPVVAHGTGVVVKGLRMCNSGIHFRWVKDMLWR